jgi:hypothetical protein
MESRELLTPASNTPRTFRRCLLITLPDSVDALWWRERCATFDQEATHLNAGRAVVPGLRMHTCITYPQLLLWEDYSPAQQEKLTSIRRVYVAWHARIRWFHLARHIARLELSQVASVDPAWAGQLRVGARYLWVDAEPLPVPDDLPMPTIPLTWQTPVYPGLLIERGRDELVPYWKSASE